MPKKIPLFTYIKKKLIGSSGSSVDGYNSNSNSNSSHENHFRKTGGFDSTDYKDNSKSPNYKADTP